MISELAPVIADLVNESKLPSKPLSPGVAGHAGTKERVADGNGHKMLVKPTVDPGVGHHVRGVCYGATCTRA